MNLRGRLERLEAFAGSSAGQGRSRAMELLHAHENARRATSSFLLKPSQQIEGPIQYAECLKPLPPFRKKTIVSPLAPIPRKGKAVFPFRGLSSHNTAARLTHAGGFEPLWAMAYPYERTRFRRPPVLVRITQPLRGLLRAFAPGPVPPMDAT